jgi:hypothetical protein
MVVAGILIFQRKAMTLKIYVAKDAKGNQWAPDTSHEAKACEWMLTKAWREFQHLQEMYAILINLRHPSADMVILTERGLGILELKHYFGEVKVNPNGIWTAGSSRIEAGSHLNPREQVRSYARDLRNKIISWILPAYMQTTKGYWDKLKFQTGVCFTNPNVNIQTARRNNDEKRPPLEPWESSFAIIDVDGFTSWVRELRFHLEHDRNHTKDFEPVRLLPEKIVRIATQVLSTVEWNDMYSAMPDGKPYGFLILEDTEGKQVFNLVKNYSSIGRSHECDIVIPERYSRVSKKHCAITRSIDGIEITDLDSTNGTFLRGQAAKKTSLYHGDVLLLGSETAKEKVCALKFEFGEQASLYQLATERGTQISKSSN